MRQRVGYTVVGLFGLAVLLVAGCGGPPETVYDQPEIAEGYWDAAWVEPRIYEDTDQMTMIRAEWVDSLWVRAREAKGRREVPSLEFVVSYDSCLVMLDLEVVGSPAFMEVSRQRIFEGHVPPGAYRVVLKNRVGTGAVVTGWICDREKKWTFAW